MNMIYKYDGTVLNYTPSSDTETGKWVVQGSLVGITKAPIAANTLGSITTRGVFTNVSKHNSSNALTAGQKVWLNTSNGKIYNASASGYLCVGYALEAATATAATCTILLAPTGEVGASST